MAKKLFFKMGCVICSLFLFSSVFATETTSGVNPFLGNQTSQTQSNTEPTTVKNQRENDSLMGHKALSRNIYEPLVDEVNILPLEQKEKLNDQLKKFYEKHNKADFVVLMVNNTEDLSIEEFANKAFRKWKLGTKKDNNGILLVIDTKNRSYRTEVGYGLEGDLPDGYIGRISKEVLVPQIKEGNYYLGISSYIAAISLKLDKSNDPLSGIADKFSPLEQLLIIVGICISVVVFFFIFGVEGIFIIFRIIIAILTGGKGGGSIGGGGSSGGGGNSGRY